MNKNRFKELLRSTMGDVRPLVSEQNETPQQQTPRTSSPNPGGPDTFIDTLPNNVVEPDPTPPTPPAPPKTRLPNCEFKMLTNSGPGTGSEMSGAYTKITTNGSVPPQYQGYTVHTADGPFCFIPRN